MCPEPGRIANSQAPSRGQISTSDAAGAWIRRAGSLYSSFSLPLGELQKAGRSPTAPSQWYNSVRVERPTIPRRLVWEFLWGLRHPCGDYQYIPSSQAQRHETGLLCPLVYCWAQGTNSCLLTQRPARLYHSPTFRLHASALEAYLHWIWLIRRASCFSYGVILRAYLWLKNYFEGRLTKWKWIDPLTKCSNFALRSPFIYAVRISQDFKDSFLMLTHLQVLI